MNKKLSLTLSTAILIMAGIMLAVLPASADHHEGGFVHGIVLTVDGTDYYFAGAPDGPMGEIDVPGHSWHQITDTELVGLHYNTGPNGAAQWWSSDAPDGEANPGGYRHADPPLHALSAQRRGHLCSGPRRHHYGHDGPPRCHQLGQPLGTVRLA